MPINKIITDLDGGTLKLTRTRLIELTGGTFGTRYYLNLKEFATRYRQYEKKGQFYINIYGIPGKTSVLSMFTIAVFIPYFHSSMFLKSNEGSIGCRRLSSKTFNQVVKDSLKLISKPRTVAKARTVAAGKAKSKK